MKILLINTYSMENAHRDWKNGITPSHHLWGKIELDKRGKVQVDILPYQKYKFLDKLGRIFKIEFLDQQVRSIILARKYDAIYAPYGSATTKFLVLLKFLRLTNIPIVAVAHQPQFFLHDSNPIKRWIAKISILQYDALVFLSKRMKADTQVNYRIPADKAEKMFFHMDWGPDLNFYEKYQKPIPVDQTAFAISAGTTGRDFDTIIEAFREIDFPLKIFTTASQLPTVTDIPPNVTIYSTGITYKDLLQEYYRARIILVPLKIGPNPTNTHGLTGLLDVIAMGKPTIITENKNLDLDVEKEGIGYWAKRYDPEHWRKILNGILFDEKALTQMGEKAMSLFLQTYNASLFAEGMEKIFLEVEADHNK
jgi:glycosyltransferase involved in cell wall biosynthesis